MEILNSIIENIKLNNKPIYIAGHIKPDQDSICSSLALAHFFTTLGKEAYVLLEEKDIEIIEWLEDSRYLMNNPIHTDFTFFALDVNEKKRLGRYESLFDMASLKINIDHHQDNKNEADIIYSLPNMSSTSEMIYNLIKTYDPSYIDTYIANNLYSGIVNDTNCFTRRLSNSTLIVVQDLINHGANYIHIIQKTIKERTMYEFKALAKLVNDIEYDGFHYVVVDKANEAFINLTHNQIVKKIAEDLRTIKGMDVFVVLIKDNDTIVAKCMSNISENADKIASLFGGGGHKKEAGFTISNIEIPSIIAKIKEYLQANKLKRKN